jgi:hypothetical protein
MIMMYIPVKSPAEAAIDARFLNVSSSILKRSAESMDTNLCSFSAAEYSKNIVS